MNDFNYTVFTHYMSHTIKGVDNEKYSHHLDILIDVYKNELFLKINKNKGLTSLLYKDKLFFNTCYQGYKSLNIYLFKLLKEIAADDNYSKLEYLFKKEYMK